MRDIGAMRKACVNVKPEASEPDPDYRALLVEAAEALEAVLDSLGALSNPSELHGYGLTDRPLKTLARSRAALEGK